MFTSLSILRLALPASLLFPLNLTASSLKDAFRGVVHRHLEEVQLKIIGLCIGHAEWFFHVDGEGWTVLRDHLSPTSCPHLKLLRVVVSWCYTDKGDAEGGEEWFNQRMGGMFRDMLRDCLPGWENDRRGLVIRYEVDSAVE